MNQRTENKFLVKTEDTLSLFTQWTKLGLLYSDVVDEFSRETYTVESLYFDGVDYECLEDAIEGHPNRKKIRLRQYRSQDGTESSQRFIEAKCKSGYYSNKYRKNVDSTFSMGLLPTVRFDDVEFLGPWIPQLVVEYERRPRTFLGDVRVTLDSDIRVKVASMFGHVVPAQLIISPEWSVLEIKGEGPKQICNAIDFLSQSLEIRSTRFSKYCLASFCLNADNNQGPWTQHSDYWSIYRNVLNVSSFQNRFA